MTLAWVRAIAATVLAFRLVVAWTALGRTEGEAEDQPAVEAVGLLAFACDGPDVDPWVTATAGRVPRYDAIFAFAVGLYGEATGCTGRVTDEFDGARFGVVTWTFMGGVVFELQTMPPETSRVSLSVPEGFEDPVAATASLRAYTDGVGVAIDWDAPDVSLDGDAEVRSYWDPDSGLNASASLVFVGEVLVELRFSMAL